MDDDMKSTDSLIALVEQYKVRREVQANPGAGEDPRLSLNAFLMSLPGKGESTSSWDEDAWVEAALALGFAEDEVCDALEILAMYASVAEK